MPREAKLKQSHASEPQDDKEGEKGEDPPFGLGDGKGHEEDDNKALLLHRDSHAKLRRAATRAGSKRRFPQREESATLIKDEALFHGHLRDGDGECGAPRAVGRP